MANYTTKLSTAWAAFAAQMAKLEGRAGNGSNLLIRKVAQGEYPLETFPTPYVTIQVLTPKVVSKSDTGRIWQVACKIKIVTPLVTGSLGSFDEVLAKIAQVEDQIEAFVRPDGVQGFEDSDWSVATNLSPSHGGLAMADSTRNFTVNVARGAN